MVSLQLIFSLLLIICLYVFFEIAVFFNDKWNIGDLKLYIILTTLFFLFQDFIRRYFIIKVKYFKLLIIDTIAYLGQIVAIFYLIYTNNLNLKMVFLVLSLSFGLSFVIGFFNIKKTKTKSLHRKLLFIKNWQFSKWLVYSAILQWGSGNFFILVAGAILGSTAVAVIKVMQNTMGVFHVLFIALENILPINFSKIYKKDGYHNMIKYFKLQIKYGIIIFSIFTSFIYIFKSDIINLFYGIEYVEYSYLLVGFFLVYMCIYITLLQKYVLRTLELTKVIFISYVITTLFAFLSSYTLITYFKINGVLIGILFMQIITSMIFYRYIILNSKKYD